MKKRRENNGAIAGIILSATIVRRHRRLHRLVFQLISAASACLLLFLVAFSLLAPSPALHQLDHDLSSRHHLFARDGGEERQSDLEEETAFRVPASGGSTGRDLWRTTHSESFFGCSNASRNFVRHIRLFVPANNKQRGVMDIYENFDGIIL